MVQATLNNGPYGMEQLPPQNGDAERSLLGSMLRDNSCIDEVVLLLRSESFYHDAHQKIFRAVTDIHKKSGHPVDLVLLHEELNKRGQLEDVGRAAYLAQVWNESPTGANAVHYAQIVRDKAILRQLIHAATQIMRDAQEQSGPAENVLVTAEQKVLAISELGINGTTCSLREQIADTARHIDRLSSGQRTMGVPTGYIDLDELTCGFHAGELILLGARPSIGKTSFGLSLANNARKNGFGVFFASLEQTRQELAMRLMCMEARVSSHHVRKGILSRDDTIRLADAIPGLKEGIFHIDDAPRQSMTRIAANGRRLKRQQGIGLVVVDYVQLIDPDNRRDPRHEQVGQSSRRLKELAKELSLPVLALAQVNRGAEERPNQRPRLSDLRESGSLEADADTVLLLHRNEEQAPGVIEVIVAKQRNGPTGDISLAFRKESMRFEDYIPDAPFGA